MKIVLLSLIGIIAAYILLEIISALFVSRTREYDRNSPYYRWLLNSASQIMVWLLHIRIHATGLEKLPKDGRFLLVSNHRSNFDPILTWVVLRKYDLAFVSKEENFHIPVFGRIIRRCCFLAIDRENPRNALVTIEKAAKLIADDTVSICIYPEGTRSKESRLLPFHAGVFKIAQRADVPVVVMTIQGTEKIHKNVPFKKTNICFDVLEAIPANEVKSYKSVELSSRVRALMEDRIVRDDKENTET